jgi:hypothetical protein
MRTLLALSFLFSTLLHAENASFLVRPSEPAPQSKALWRVSLSTLATANAMDIHSSWGKRELNGLLAGPNQRFGVKGTVLKLAFQGGLMGAEYLITRGHTSGRMFRALAWINFGAAAGITSVAVHNYTVPGMPR